MGVSVENATNIAPYYKRSSLSTKRGQISELIRRIVLDIFSLGLAELAFFGFKKIKRVLIPLFLPAASQSEHLREQALELKMEFLEKHQNSSLLTIKTEDNAELEALEVRNKTKTDKWIIKFCGNAQNFPFHLKANRKLAKDIGANLLLFNYRCVGQSKGSLENPSDLIIDGSAMVEYLKQYKGAAEEDILLYGFSLGGAVAVLTAERFPGINVFSERSFGSLAKAAKYKMPNKLLGTLVSLAVKLLKVEMDAVRAWRRIPRNCKMMTHHRYDGVVKYPASHYKAIKEHVKKKYSARWKKHGKCSLKKRHKPESIKIKGGISEISKSNHTFSLRDGDGKAYRAIVSSCKKMLNKKASLG